jgi:hypothetical protein
MSCDRVCPKCSAEYDCRHVGCPACESRDRAAIKLSKPCYRFIACSDWAKDKLGRSRLKHFRERVRAQTFTYRGVPLMVDHRLHEWRGLGKKKTRRWVVSHEASGLKIRGTAATRKQAIENACNELDGCPDLAKRLKSPHVSLGARVIKKAA